LLTAFAMFYVATVDTIYTIKHLAHYTSDGMDIASSISLREQTITHIVEIVDGFLLASVLLIFSMGLYELFISKIDVAEGTETSNSVLHTNSLDDLKNRLAKVILMILIVNFLNRYSKYNSKHLNHFSIYQVGLP
jgi:uncharacterized membrane protein YqhA